MNLDIKIDNEGYCDKCNNFHNCTSCPIMDNLQLNPNLIKLTIKRTSLKIQKAIESRNIDPKVTELSNEAPFCGRCGGQMVFGENKRYHCYSCEFNVRINR